MLSLTVDDRVLTLLAISSIDRLRLSILPELRCIFIVKSFTVESSTEPSLPSLPSLPGAPGSPLGPCGPGTPCFPGLALIDLISASRAVIRLSSSFIALVLSLSPGLLGRIGMLGEGVQPGRAP